MRAEVFSYLWRTDPSELCKYTHKQCPDISQPKGNIGSWIQFLPLLKMEGSRNVSEMAEKKVTGDWQINSVMKK